MTIYPSTRDPMPNETMACAIGAMIAIEFLRQADALPEIISFVKAACDNDQFTVLAGRQIV